MNLDPGKIKDFQVYIFSWWKTHKRDLPWRRTHNPYRILVSEVMLQQTQVSRVYKKYLQFIERFPTVVALAQASPSDVLRMWKGMGYNRRALYLHNMAKEVVYALDGKFPREEKLLMKLPGLGIYTARAVLVFAYKKDVAAIDTNVKKIITHFFFDDQPQKTNIIAQVADNLVPKGKSWQWHQALMDYGAVESQKWKVKSGRKKQKPFKETNRFFRGQIIDLLREKEWDEKKLIDYLIQTYGKPGEFFHDRMNDLMKEKLVDRSLYGIVHLPR